MASGAWRLNGESIIFDESSCLDGQHRLLAVVQSGVTIESVVVENIDASAFSTLDSGKARSSADNLALERISNAKDVASGARFVYFEEQGDPGQLLRTIQTSNADIVDVVRRHPGLVAAASTVAGLKNTRRLLTGSISTYLYYRFSCINREDADRFFLLLESGEGLRSDDPIYLLRERLLGNKIGKAKLPRAEILALSIKAWNNARSNRSTRHLRWRRNGEASEPFPTINGGLATLPSVAMHG
jgi:hypothetical protein